MKLLCLRHGIAVERGTPGYDDDALRPLTTEGRARMLSNAKALHALDLSFDVVLTSPYARAKQTADIICDVFAIKPARRIISKNLTPDADHDALLKELDVDAKKYKTILCVGHEPYLSELVSYLLTGGRQIPIELKKGGICQLNITKLSATGSATLEWLLTPAQLKLMVPKNK